MTIREQIANSIQQISDDFWMWLAYVANRMEEEKYRDVPLLADADLVPLSDVDSYIDDDIIQGIVDESVEDTYCTDHQSFCDDWFYDTLFIDNC